MIVEIASTGRRLRAADGFLYIDDARLPLEDLDALILATPAVTVTGEALIRLGENGIPVVLCDRAYRPLMLAEAVGGHSRTAGRLALQSVAPQALKDSLRAQIIRAKIERQAEVVALVGGPVGRFRSMARYVKDGDPENLEARAAREYWPAVFGNGFRRKAEGPPPNPALNYGYAVVRAAMARAISAHGLHPALGLFHRSETNPFCLADDLIEPFRPLVDRAVLALGDAALADELSVDARETLAEILQAEIGLSGRAYGVRGACAELVQSLVRVMTNGRGRLALPQSLDPPSRAAVEEGEDAEPLPPDVDVRAL